MFRNVQERAATGSSNDSSHFGQAYFPRALEQCAAGVQDLGKGRTQFAGQRRNRSFDVDVSTIHLLGSEQVWELLENIFTDHLRLRGDFHSNS